MGWRRLWRVAQLLPAGVLLVSLDRLSANGAREEQRATGDSTPEAGSAHGRSKSSDSSGLLDVGNAHRLET